MTWIKSHVIGQGSTSTVHLATSPFSGQISAVKSAEFSQSEPLQREQQILSTLNSPYIVTYKGHHITRDGNDKFMFNLVLEYVPGGTLFDVIRAHGGRLNESLIRVLTGQIVLGLDYIHQKGLVHCDIKSQNVLIDTDGAKIADFGCAKLADEHRSFCGTPLFMAPEVARGEKQTCSADIWALGCVIIEMATGLSPWINNSNDPFSILYQIAYSNELPEFPDFLSSQTKDFLGKCLRRNAEERWTASQLLNHPFLLGEFESLAKHVDEFKSPTSVLHQDHVIWDSFQDSGSSINLSRISTENSPAERIGRLSRFSELPSCWDCDEKYWTTVYTGQ